MWWIVSLKHNTLVQKVHFSNFYSKVHSPNAANYFSAHEISLRFTKWITVEFNNFQSKTSLVESLYDKFDFKKQAAYCSCRFVHHSAVFCQLISVCNHCKSAQCYCWCTALTSDWFLGYYQCRSAPTNGSFWGYCQYEPYYQCRPHY